MKKLTVFVLLCATLLGAIPFFVGGSTAAPLFSVRVNCGMEENVTSDLLQMAYAWVPESPDSLVTLTVADGRKTDGIYVAWMSNDGQFLIRARDKSGKTVKEYRPGDQFDGFGNFYALPETTKTVEISFTAITESCGIGQVKMEEAGANDPTIMRWQAPKDGGVDLLVVPTHQDDEYIYLGGVAPYFLDLGYSVSIAYSVRCNRSRYEEALRGLWALGFVEYPDFLGYRDGRLETYQEVIDLWGGDENAVLTSFVRLIRRKKPQVIVSHDEVDGESYHQQHIVTAKLLAEAFVKAADPDFDPESVKTYGTWQAKKYYEHVWKKNVVQLDYTKKLKKYGGLNALEVSAVGYEYHVSQHEFYHVFRGGKNDSSVYGLRLSTVGYDDIDMFYNVKGKNFTKKEIVDHGAREWVTAPEVTMKLTKTGVQLTPAGGVIPIDTTVVTTKPVTTKPITTKPVTTKPITTKPVTTKPVTTKPITTKPVTTKPLTTTQIPTTEIITTTVPTAPVTTTAQTTTAPVTTTTQTTPITTTVSTTPVSTLPVTTVPITTELITTELITTSPVTTVPVTEQTSGDPANKKTPVHIAVIVGCLVLVSAEIAIPAVMRNMRKKNKKKEDK